MIYLVRVRVRECFVLIKEGAGRDKIKVIYGDSIYYIINAWARNVRGVALQNVNSWRTPLKGRSDRWHYGEFCALFPFTDAEEVEAEETTLWADIFRSVIASYIHIFLYASNTAKFVDCSSPIRENYLKRII